MEQLFRNEINAVMRNNLLYNILQMRVLELVKLFINFSFILPPPDSKHGPNQTT